MLTPKKINETTEFVLAIDLQDLTEATVDAEKRTVMATALKSGWSKNGRYYSEKVTESLAEHLKQKGKVYLNHQLRPAGNRKYLGGRDMRDWAAQISDARGVKGSTVVEMHVFDKPDGWLLERIQHCPEEVGLSIDARGVIRRGKVEGKEGDIVESFVKVNSLDFVPTPAAGGRVERLAAMERGDTEVIDEIMSALDNIEETENVKAFKKFFEKVQDGDEPDDLLETLFTEISKTVYEDVEYPSEAYLYVPNPNKPNTWRYRVKVYEGKKLIVDKGTVNRSMKEFSYDLIDGYILFSESESTNIKDQFRKLLKKFGISDEKIPLSIRVGECTKEELKDNFFELFKEDSTVTEGLKKKLTDNITKEGEQIVDWKDVKIEELTTERPDLIEAIKEVFQKEHDEKGELAEATEKIKELEKEAEVKEEENKETQVKLDEYQVKEKLEIKKKAINEKIESAELPKEAITEIFMETLETAEDENIDKLIADRKDLVDAKKGKVKDLGSNDKKKETKSELPTTDDLAKAV